MASKISTLGLLAAATSSVMAAGASDWAQRSIYQLVTDRFAKTTDDGGPCDSAARQYCGGTWQGIINHLDYIQGMGFDAIWISPVVQNIDGNTTYGEAYHGYWPLDFQALNPHFGAPSDLKALSTALHSRGMYLMLDVIINHVAATSTPPTLTYTGYTPYSSAEDYHSFCWIDDYNNQTQVEQCWVGDQNVALADLDTESQVVIDGHAAWVKDLVGTYAVDGLRIDTAKHVRQDFYPAWLEAAGVWAVAEILDVRANYTGSYTNYIDSTFNYPQWFKLCTAFQNAQADMSVLVQSFKDTQTYFKNGGLGTTVSFSENHDNARLPSMIPDPVLVKNIISWTFVGDGIPVLYYGQEASYSGGNDPMNREALWFTSYSTDVSLYSHVSKLNAARKAGLASPKFTTTPASIAASTNQHIAVQKYPLLGVFTNAGNASMAQWTVPVSSPFKVNDTLVDVVSANCDTVTVAKDGTVPIQFNAGNPKVYVAATSLNSTGVCGGKAQAKTDDSGALGRAGMSGAAVVVAAVLAGLAVLF